MSLSSSVAKKLAHFPATGEEKYLLACLQSTKVAPQGQPYSDSCNVHLLQTLNYIFRMRDLNFKDSHK